MSNLDLDAACKTNYIIIYTDVIYISLRRLHKNVQVIITFYLSEGSHCDKF